MGLTGPGEQCKGKRADESYDLRYGMEIMLMTWQLLITPNREVSFILIVKYFVAFRIIYVIHFILSLFFIRINSHSTLG